MSHMTCDISLGSKQPTGGLPHPRCVPTRAVPGTQSVRRRRGDAGTAIRAGTASGEDPTKRCDTLSHAPKACDGAIPPGFYDDISPPGYTCTQFRAFDGPHAPPVHSTQHRTAPLACNLSHHPQRTIPACMHPPDETGDVNQQAGRAAASAQASCWARTGPREGPACSRGARAVHLWPQRSIPMSTEQSHSPRLRGVLQRRGRLPQM